MMKACDKPLKSNPFTTYRDPQTGKWIVVQQEQNKVADTGKSRCFSNVVVKSFEKHLELQVQPVAA
ncbi:MAG TPA: hypothetical protein VK211_08340 [Kamptonema sp.]|nr:hypothetical protein [Kamptonema sp.]